MSIAGLYIEELFQFDEEWYALLKSDINKDFLRYVKVIKIRPDGCDWISLNVTMENAVKYFHNKDNEKIKKNK